MTAKEAKEIYEKACPLIFNEEHAELMLQTMRNKAEAGFSHFNFNDVFPKGQEAVMFEYAERLRGLGFTVLIDPQSHWRNHHDFVVSWAGVFVS